MGNQEMISAFVNSSRIEKNLSPRTLKAYTCDLCLAELYLRPKTLDVVTRNDIRDYIDHLCRQGLRDSTIRRKLATLKVFYHFLEEEDFINMNPLSSLRRRFKVRKKLPRVMSSNEIEALLKAAYSEIFRARQIQGFGRFRRYRDYSILELLFATGIRIDELVQIDLDDLDMDRRALLIKGKGRKERMVYMVCDEVTQAIEGYLQQRHLVKTRSVALFLNKFKTRLSTHAIGNIFREYCRIAGITRKVTPHCLRHTMATMLIENGADVRTVQEILGHSNISTTEIYLHISKNHKQRVLSECNIRNYIKIWDSE